MVVVIDSDKSGPDDDLKPHAQRLLDEIDDEDGIVWITAGREMENYIDGQKLQDALKTLHPHLYVKEGKTGPFDHAFYFFRKNSKEPNRNETYKNGDKVGAASLIAECAPDFTVLDLGERVEQLVTFLKYVNGLS